MRFNKVLLPLMGVAGLVILGSGAISFARADVNPTKAIVSGIEYVSDSRSGLCFAVHDNTFAQVPCDRVPASSSEGSLAAIYVREIQYARDSRSGLCFGVHYGSIMVVPCESVKSLISG